MVYMDGFDPSLLPKTRLGIRRLVRAIGQKAMKTPLPLQQISGSHP